MWVIYVNGVASFWLLSGEVYRIGAKDCHILIHDDRSISRTHLSIEVATHNSDQACNSPLRDAAHYSHHHVRGGGGGSSSMGSGSSSSQGIATKDSANAGIGRVEAHCPETTTPLLPVAVSSSRSSQASSYPATAQPATSSHDAFRHSTSTDVSPVPLTLIDSSTYGTRVIARGSADTGRAVLMDGCVPRIGGHDRSNNKQHNNEDSSPINSANSINHDTPCDTSYGIGVDDRSAEVDENRMRHASHVAAIHDSAKTDTGIDNSALSGAERVRLIKGTPFHLPRHRAEWLAFDVVLGNHHAMLRFVWVDVTAVVERVQAEVRERLHYALRQCGVRILSHTYGKQNRANSDKCRNGNIRADGRASSTTHSPNEWCAADWAAHEPVVPSNHRISTYAVPHMQNNSMNGRGHQQDGISLLPFHCAQADFLITSTLIPSSITLAMLCRAAPIVKPSFFIDIAQRPNAQQALPIWHQHEPALSPAWRSVIARPSRTIATAKEQASVDAALNALLHSRHTPRHALFAGVCFLVLQSTLYEEVIQFLPFAGGRVVWVRTLDECCRIAAAVASADESSASLLSGRASLSSSSLPLAGVTQPYYSASSGCTYVLLVSMSIALPADVSCIAALHARTRLHCVEIGEVVNCIARGMQLPGVRYMQPQIPTDVEDEVPLDQVNSHNQADRPTVEDELAEGISPAALAAVASQEKDGEQEVCIVGVRPASPQRDSGRRTDADPLFPELVGAGGAGTGSQTVMPSRRRARSSSMGWIDRSGGSNKNDKISRNSNASSNRIMAAVQVHDPVASQLPLYPCFMSRRNSNTNNAVELVEVDDNTSDSSSNPTRRSIFTKQRVRGPPVMSNLDGASSGTIPTVSKSQERSSARTGVGDYGNSVPALISSVDVDWSAPLQPSLRQSNRNNDSCVSSSNDNRLGTFTNLMQSPCVPSRQQASDRDGGVRAEGFDAAAAAGTEGLFNTYDLLAQDAANRQRGTAPRRGRTMVAPDVVIAATTQRNRALSAESASRTVMLVDHTVRDRTHRSHHHGDGRSSNRVSKNRGTEGAFNVFDVDGLFF